MDPLRRNADKKRINMAKDPICGMMVDEATAIRAERDCQTIYFCSERCRHTFLQQIQPTSPVDEQRNPTATHVKATAATLAARPNPRFTTTFTHITKNTMVAR